jgi:hypothetical protein
MDLKHTKVSAAFIEFSNQSAAHHAYQTVGRESKLKFDPRYIGVQPEEVVWQNLGVTKASRKVKILIATVIIWLMIIFWTIPVAFVGILTNINYLTNKVSFLSFINKIPSPILGVVTGLLPTILLAVLMALVPIFCRLLAKKAGEPTLSAIELKTQSWYFSFQVVQVFLITTFTSGKKAHVPFFRIAILTIARCFRCCHTDYSEPWYCSNAACDQSAQGVQFLHQLLHPFRPCTSCSSTTKHCPSVDLRCPWQAP